ncbi:FtsK/SpoIIIE domain-containing protein [Actinocrispum wychmicini]|uniref:S-DNA-T family DNA segregation ATPase FtsK/SpoIIIE n=1 Tax=Actinocrispum wychmicini TaxID=1213861 RepID=A0A4R2K589_9PSEU|nr:FtsK/SpoIIIE domain-containing protein [Actinocrispum wychmicini]TCO64989.1 S-DNA-T family DNA segregation ATPase FtsK/SpoIIIE [Actinocrispum wychmicini]
MNADEHPVNDAPAGAELERKIYDAEFVTDDTPRPAPSGIRRWTPAGRRHTRTRIARWLAGLLRRAWQSSPFVRARSVAAYRMRKLPMDVARLAWFVARGHWRWLVKFWNWATYADLRADARSARLAGNTEARRTAQELIRSDAKARWAKVGIAVRRIVVAVRVLGPVAIVLWATDSWLDRADMWPWLADVYTGMDAVWSVLTVAGPIVLWLAPLAWLVAAVFEGRDKTPGAGWLVHPERDDNDSWIDERMISVALAHLGITPLNRFFKDGGALAYTVAARKDGDGTYAQIRLPLGVTADMVAARRPTLAANLGRASLETWPTKGEEDGLLDLWVADKGALNGGAGDWPLLTDGQVDLFDGVPFGLTQRGLVINAPLIGANWLVGGRPGQGKSACLRTLLLGAALDPTAELWVFVMGESPDFDPFTPRLARYRMGMDDAVAEAALQGLSDLLEEMERRGKVLGQQPGRPPKVSRKLADQRHLGLHPLVCAIDECHELFQHPKYGKQAAEMAIRLIKRGRKYGIVLLLATQSPTKDSIPREVTRNISCGVAFSVADQIANDGLLGSGKYRAGIRATDLRMNTDRGTCVAVGVTDATFELVRTFYVPFEDGTDDVSPVIARALAIMQETGRQIQIQTPDRLEIDAAPVDHLAAIAAVMRDGRRVRTQVMLSRLAEHNPAEYEGWTFADLTAALTEQGITPVKSHGNMAVRSEDVTAKLTARAQDTTGEPGGESDGEDTETRGGNPRTSPSRNPRSDQRKHPSGEAGEAHSRLFDTPENPRKHGVGTSAPDPLPAVDSPDDWGSDDG